MEKTSVKKCPVICRTASGAGLPVFSALFLAALLLALTGCPDLSGSGSSFVAVTGITGVPTTGTAGIPVDLTGAKVTPTNATYQVITWAVAEAGNTGVTGAGIVNGNFTPANAGSLVLSATVANGTEEGVDFSRQFTITIAGPSAITYTAAADGTAGTETSTAIIFSFGAAVDGLTADNITVTNGTGSVTKGALTGSGQTWTLAVTVATAGNVTVSISKTGIESAGKPVAVHKQGETPDIDYTVAADGTAGTTASAAITFTFGAAVTGLTAGDITLGKTGDTGSVTKGALTGEGQTWTLALDSVATAGNVTVSISKTGIVSDGKTVAVYKQAVTPDAITYTAAANGTADTTASTAITFTFGADITGLAAGDITVGKSGDTGSATKGALTGSGQTWTLAITVATAGNVTVSISKTGIESAEKPVAVYKQGETGDIAYNVSANGTANTTTSTAITFTFGAAVTGLTADNIAVGKPGDTGSVTKGALTGSGQTWTLALTSVATAGDVTVSITKTGIESAAQTVRVYKEAGPPPPPPTGSLAVTIAVIDGAVTVEGDGGANIIKKGGDPDSLTLRASGFTDIHWSVDGSSTVLTANPLVLNAAYYETRKHSVTFYGVKGVVPYSRIVEFTVEEEPGIARVGPVSAADLAAALAWLPSGTPDAPSVVALDSTVDVNSTTWGTTIAGALAGVTKYITLDLSACTAAGNTISGDSSPSAAGDFNIIKTTTDYITGIILPAALTQIGDSAFSHWTSLKKVVIPNGVTAIGREAFRQCTNLSIITLPEGLQSIGQSAFPYPGFTAITIPASVTSIGSTAFMSCVNLTRVTFEGNSAVLYSATLGVHSFPNYLDTLYNSQPANARAGTYTYSEETGWVKE
jgi:hypothetical protein